MVFHTLFHAKKIKSRLRGIVITKFTTVIENKIRTENNEIIHMAFSRAVAQHSALRAPPGGAESTKLSIGRGFSSDGTS